MKNIVILGAGYGGIRCALDLGKRLPPGYDLFLVDKYDHHTPQSLLYEIACSSLGETPQEYEILKKTICIFIPKIIKNLPITFLKKEAANVFLKDKAVVFSDRSRLSFDYLVFALGSETNHFDIPGLKEHSYGLKEFSEALNIRNKIEEIISSKKPDESVSIVVGGGGFSGVEFAGELGNCLPKLAAKYRLPRKMISLTIVEARGQLLPGAKSEIVRKAELRLKRLGVEVLFESPIEKFDGSALRLKNGKTLKADILVWTAGVKGVKLLENLGLPLERACLPVTDFLQLRGFEGVFGVGDNIFCFDPKTQTSLPLTAQRAIDQGRIAAKNIIRHIKGMPLLPFRARKPFFIIPIGGKYAMADLKVFLISGMLGWLIKMLIWLKYLVSILPLKQAAVTWIRGVKIFVKND